MSWEIYAVMHVASALLLVGVTFAAFASPTPERRKPALLWSGILSLLMLTGGFGLLARLYEGWPAWVLVKVVCWLGLSALAGMAFRRPGSVGGLRIVATVLILVALVMVYMKPIA